MKTIRSLSLTLLGVCVGQMLFHTFAKESPNINVWFTFGFIFLTTYTITAIHQK